MQGVIKHQNLRPDLSVADIAYHILKDRREPVKYRELVEQVLELKGLKPGQNPAKVKARIHTEISIDSRFMNQGSGLCGLREWTVKPPAYKVLEISTGSSVKPGERLRKELAVITEEEDDYEEESEDVDYPLDEDEEVEPFEEFEEPEE